MKRPPDTSTLDLFGVPLSPTEATLHRPAVPRRDQDMHPDSLDAYHGALAQLAGRAEEVYLWLQHHGPATDRQVMIGLGFADMNAVRPRITELIDAHLLYECGQKIDPATRKTVRIVKVAGDNNAA